MKSIRSKIFDKKYKVIFHFENEIMYNVIEEQLSYYPQFSNDETSDVIINICENLTHHKILKKNPSVHLEIENGFIAEFPTYKVAFFLIDQILHIDLAIKPSGNFFFSFVRKFINMEFAIREERIAETLFEAAIIPSLFFDSKKFIVHSSGFVRNGNAIIIGGTGGSGKTSIEIELCLNQNCEFVNDDIAVVKTDGDLLPNLAHPKIYGYNLIGNKNLKQKLLSNRSIFDRFHWWFTYNIFGAAKVRRRLFIKDNIAFISKSIPLKKYFILSKENVESITLEKISAEEATNLHLNVILAEYNLFINHFYWHEFNSILNNSQPIIKYEQVRENLSKNSLAVFEKTDNYILRIPMKMDHTDFLKNAVKKILEAD